MAGVNKVILLGNLGADPEVKYLEGDKVVANLSLATTEAYNDRSGNRVEQTEWHDLELWDQQAKIAEKYLKKGSQIFVEGKIKSDKWTDDQGQNRKKTKIRVLSFTMVGGRPEGMGGAASPVQNSQQTPAVRKEAESVSGGGNSTISLDDAEDDLPF
jgi:single-strand DNA-binding protein